jgi:hypothetical protein
LETGARGSPSAPVITCHQACKPGSVPRLNEAMAIHLGRRLRGASCNQPGRLVWKQTGTVSRPRRPYSVLLPVGFAVPPLLPKTRCALTAPFHPYSAFALSGYGATRLLRLAAPKQLWLRKRGGLLSVALSLGSPPPEVIRHRASMEPGLSSPPWIRKELAERPSGLLTEVIRGLHPLTSSN